MVNACETRYKAYTRPITIAINAAENGDKCSLHEYLYDYPKIEFNYISYCGSVWLVYGSGSRDLIDAPIYNKIKAILECCVQNTSIVLTSFPVRMIQSTDAWTIHDFSNVNSLTLKGEYELTDLIDFAKRVSSTSLKALVIHKTNHCNSVNTLTLPELTSLINALRESNVKDLSVGELPFQISDEKEDKTLAEALKNTKITSLPVSYHYGNAWFTTYHVNQQLKMNNTSTSSSPLDQTGRPLLDPLIVPFKNLVFTQPGTVPIDPRIEEAATQTLYRQEKTDSDNSAESSQAIILNSTSVHDKR